jgi:hypothetical protein
MALGAFLDLVNAQVASNPSTALVVHEQLKSIAEEVAGRVLFDAGNKVVVNINAEKDLTLVENAFLQALDRKGFPARLYRGPDSVDVSLKVDLLTDRVSFDEAAGGAFVRTVQIDLEARVEYAAKRPAEVFCLFHRTAIDTVSQKDPGALVKLGIRSIDAETTLFQRLVGPLIVLAGSIIVVYLFFTVRS